MKKKLTTAPVLAYPEFHEGAGRFILDTDFSTETRSMGAVLSQIQNGVERPISYAGKRLNNAQVAYSAHKGELFSAVFFMKYFAYYLKARPFLFRTDHSALKHMTTLKDPGSFTVRLLDALSSFQFDVEHRAGTAHGNADSLSRAPHHEPIEDHEVPENEDVGIATAEIPEKTASDDSGNEQDEDVGDPTDGTLRTGRNNASP